MRADTVTTTRAIAFTAAFLLLSSGAARADYITNGGFEAVQITTEYTTNPADVPGWTHTGPVGDALLLRAGPQCCGGTNKALAGEGDQFVSLGGGYTSLGSTEAWSQTVNGLVTGQTYAVNFLLASEGETPTQKITVGFTSGSSTPSQTFTSIPTHTLFWQNWGPEQYTFVAADTSATLQFSVTNQQYDVGLDGVSIAPQTSPVPEPRSFLLAIAGLLGAALLARRRVENAPR